MSSTDYNRIPTVEGAPALASTSESTVTLVEDPNAVSASLWSPVYKRTKPEIPRKASPTFSSEELKQKDVALPCRKSTSSSTIQQAVVDSFFCIPALGFIIYGILLCRFDQTRSDSLPVLRLQTVATFGPTLFPIAYAAALANLLKTFSQWTLERGVTVLDLHYLQSSRTVFSAVSTAVKTRALSYMTLPIIILWLLSPLGGQASLRAVTQGPQATKSRWDGRFLDTAGSWSTRGLVDPGGESRLSAINDAFKSAISSPLGMKSASSDAFGNVKIPMIESLILSNISRDSNGWYEVKGREDLEYSSLSGLPIRSVNETNALFNFTFTMPTSYLSVQCETLDHSPMAGGKWYSHARASEKIDKEVQRTTYFKGIEKTYNETRAFKRRKYFNGDGLILKLWRGFEELWPIDPKRPLGFEFESFHGEGVTKATCGVNTTHVEANISCWRKDCTVDHIRHIQKTDSNHLTVLHRSGVIDHGFFASFVNATSDNLGSQKGDEFIRPSPLECYLINPSFPYAWTAPSAWTAFAQCATDRNKPPYMWDISDKLLSQRMTQLLNTFWINGIAPYINSGEILLVSGANGLRLPVDKKQYPGVDARGWMVPDYQVMRVSFIWLVVLFFSSTIMLLAAIGAVVFGALRRGPESLEYIASLLKDNRNINVEGLGSSVMEGDDLTRFMKDVVLYLGDVRPDEDSGYLAITTSSDVGQLGRQAPTRRYA